MGSIFCLCAVLSRFGFVFLFFSFGILDLVYKIQEALLTRRNTKDCVGRPVLHILRTA